MSWYFKGDKMKHFLIDAHCDTITRIMEDNKDLFKNDCHIDIERLRNFDSVQFFAIWLDSKYYTNAYEQTLKYIDFYNQQIEKYNKFIAKAITVKDINKNKADNKISAVLAIEGGEALDGKLENLQALYNLGVRAMTLTWNYDNQIAGGANGNSGMTQFGYDVVNKMYNIGMIIDVSHLSEKSFWDFDKIAKGSYMASHSNVKNLCSHRRNLSDEQIKAIANKDGVIGMNLYSGFLSFNEFSNIEDILNHIDYIINLVGSDYIGFGCDFDGIDRTPDSISDVSKLDILIQKLLTKYGDTITEKILNLNFMRLINNIWKS